jgi:tRNA threonylcarbamoyladenosine biosynthesis protein TsaB
MLILAVDTSGRNGGLALVRFDAGQPRVLEAVPLAGGTFSAQLVPQISALVARNQLAKTDIGGFAVVTGPGSFTGLRVGLAAVKALGEVLRKPIAAVSLLEAMASAAGAEGRILAVIVAGRQELYAGTYEVQEAASLCLSEQLFSLDELSSQARGSLVVVSEPDVAERLGKRGLAVRLIPYPGADVIARLGFSKIESGEIVSPEALDAAYARPSDAEIKKSDRRMR